MKRKVILTLAGILILACAGILLLFLQPHLYVCLMQRMGMVSGEVNSYEPKSIQETQELNNNITLYKNIQYGEQYPNSYLDIYKNKQDKEGTFHVFFYIHGGGYAWGDKAEGDPTADSGDVGEATEYLQRICASGYHVVSVNYALTPEYTYPTPIFQIDEAVRFLKENAGDLGLNMTEIVFSGGSAGGQLAGQYVNIQTNPDYAGQMNMEPVLSSAEIKGVVFSCALLQPRNFAKTGNLYTNFMFSELKRVYFGNDSTVLNEADVIGHIGPDFPPAYITDGNQATFDKQAAELNERLNELGIYHIYNYYDRAEAALGHGYDSFLDDPYAQDNLDKLIIFLQDTALPIL